MDIKSEIEIKMEELDFENDFSQDYQNFPHIESNISLPEIKNEELDQMTSFTIKSEAGESEIEFGIDEEQVQNNVIKSENPAMITKFNTQHSLMMNAAEEEKDLEVKSTSRSKPQRSIVHQQSIKKCHQENLSCRYCKFSFKSKDELKTHLKTHNKRKFKCAHCSFESNFKTSLKNHLMTHSNEKLFKCSDCSYECYQKGSLKRHMLTHSNLKLFKCSDCSYECNDKGSLKSHMLTHTNVKLFKCSDCSYECNHKGSLKSHMLTHTNVKLFKCSDCSYECNHKGSLKRHMLTHTKTF
ncbi:UNVERIFIED_CONTAM: hypothetical protein RMT77_016753 [Armadillidium vulgare]